MRRDSRGNTGEQVIGALSKEMLFIAYDDQDIADDYNKLRERLEDPETTNRDFATLLRLAWEFRLPKPKQTVGLEHEGNMQIIINEGFTDEPNKES